MDFLDQTHNDVQMNDLITNALFRVQQFSQNKWDRLKLFDATVGGEEQPCKFFVTAPMPYADILLSLNRAAALVTADVAANFSSLQGKNVLFALDFHFSGTQIQACCFSFPSSPS